MITNKATLPFSQFLTPRYWPTWLGIGLLRILFTLPYRWQITVAIRLARLFRPLLKRRLSIAKRNLELCFPEKSSDEIHRLLDAHLDSLGMAVVESVMALWGSDEQILALGQVKGLEHLKKIKDPKQGMLLLTGHFTTMELTSQLLGLHHPIAGMYRPMKNKLMDRIFLKSRMRRSTQMLTRDELRNTARALRSGSSVLYAFDQNYGQNSIFVPFFGVPAATITSTARLAKLGKALIVPFFPKRNIDGSYTVEIQAPLENFPSGDEDTDVRRLNEILEQAIIKAPEQYLWIHRRFKTRPEGEPSVYNS